MLSIEQMREIIRQNIESKPINLAIENLDLLASIGRVNAEDIYARVNLPPNAVSAMDGYALCTKGDKTLLNAKSNFVCIGTSVAGRAFTGKCEVGQCVRIMTGAVVPACCDSVVMQEKVNIIENPASSEKSIELQTKVSLGENIRAKGEELKIGDMILPKDKLIGINTIPVLASMGIKEVKVYGKIKIGIISTGDELCDLGESLAYGQIYDSNRANIAACLHNMPVEITDYGIIKDDLNAIKKALSKAAEEMDFVITSGGVSVGDCDYLKTAIDELGQILGYKVALKPGKPLVYGNLGKAKYFGLPGNPVSAFITAKLFLISAIDLTLGIKRQTIKTLAKLAEPIQHKLGRAEFIRATAWQSENGQWQVNANSSQDSHRVFQLSLANALIYLPADIGEFATGSKVEILPLFTTKLDNYL